MKKIILCVILMSLTGVLCAKEKTQRYSLNDLTVIKTIKGKAVIRFSTGKMQTVSVGDMLGETRAKVTEIFQGGMVLMEYAQDKKKLAPVARIMIKDGETGGSRHVLGPLPAPPVSSKPVVVVPLGKPKKKGSSFYQ